MLRETSEVRINWRSTVSALAPPAAPNHRAAHNKPTNITRMNQLPGKAPVHGNRRRPAPTQPSRKYIAHSRGVAIAGRASWLSPEPVTGALTSRGRSGLMAGEGARPSAALTPGPPPEHPHPGYEKGDPAIPPAAPGPAVRPLHP